MIDATIILDNKTYTGKLKQVTDDIRFVWVTDSHTRNIAQHVDRIAALDIAISQANDWADYFVHTGDMSSGDWWSFDFSFKRISDNLTIPFLWCLGNHDEEEFTYGLGSPNTAAIEAITGKIAPFYFSQVISSPDNSLKALVLSLDCNFYDDDPNGILISANHSPGDRRGIGPNAPTGGYWRMLGQSQLDWVSSTLNDNLDCNAIIILCHYIPVGQRPTDFEKLGDILQSDSRPKIGFSGHRHQDAGTWILKGGNGFPALTMYKMLALQDCLGFCRLRLGMENNNLVIREAMIEYSGIINGNIASPFVLIPEAV